MNKNRRVNENCRGEVKHGWKAENRKRVEIYRSQKGGQQ